MPFLFEKSLKINPKMSSFGRGGVQRTSFSLPKALLGQPGAQGAPGTRQRRPRHRPESQKFQKSLKIFEKSLNIFENHRKIIETSLKYHWQFIEKTLKNHGDIIEQSLKIIPSRSLHWFWNVVIRRGWTDKFRADCHIPVSYTHLTLPTICSV